MTQISLDAFVEAFSARLVTKGQNVVRLNDPEVRDGLYRVFKFLEHELGSGNEGDRAWHRSLLKIKNLFQPSPIGSFDRFEAVMRAKQVYLTDHPNPFYQDIHIKVPPVAAEQVVSRLDAPVRELVDSSVSQYLSAA